MVLERCGVGQCGIVSQFHYEIKPLLTLIHVAARVDLLPIRLLVHYCSDPAFRLDAVEWEPKYGDRSIVFRGILPITLDRFHSRPLG